MRDWIARLDDFLRMTGNEVLENAGTVSHSLAEEKAKKSTRNTRPFTRMT